MTNPIQPQHVTVPLPPPFPKYYFIIYSVVHQEKAGTNSATSGLPYLKQGNAVFPDHPFRWQKLNSQRTLVDWREITVDEFKIWVEGNKA